MGIRVHKILGYGCKARLPKGFLDTYNDLCAMPLRDFLKWMREHQNEVLRLTDRQERVFVFDVALAESQARSRDTLGKCLWYDGESGLKNVISIVPPGNPNWTRYDDPIDYSEETQVHRQRPRLKLLGTGIYPYSKGKPPLTVAAITMLLGLPEVYPSLAESIYVYWG